MFSSIRANGSDSIIMVLNSPEAQQISILLYGRATYQNLLYPDGNRWDLFKATKQYLQDNDLSFIQNFSWRKMLEKKHKNLAKNYFQSYRHQIRTEPIKMP